MLKKHHSTPVSMNTMKFDDGSYHKFQDSHTLQRRANSEADLSVSINGGFSRHSSLADLPYLALPGLTSRVSQGGAIVSLANLSDAFSDMPFHESPVYITTRPSGRLIVSVGIALQSTLLYGYNAANMNTPAPVIRASLGIPPDALTVDGDVVRMMSNDALWAFAVSIFCLGALLGCISSAQLADRWGRKAYLLLNAFLFIIGALLEAAANLPQCTLAGGWDLCAGRVAMLIAGRCVTGIGCGGASVIVPVYLGEVSPPHLRGTIGALNHLVYVSGMFVAQVLGLECMLGSLQYWPLMLAAPVVPATLQLLLQPFMVESPRWYAVIGNDLVAEDTLAKLRDRPPSDAEVQEELFCMIHTVTKNQELRAALSRCTSLSLGSRPYSSLPMGGMPSGLGICMNGSGPPSAAAVFGSNALGTPGAKMPDYEQRASLGSLGEAARPQSVFKAAVSNPAVRRAVLISCSTIAIQQCSGINNIFNFSTVWFKSIGLNDRACDMIAIAINVSNLVVAIASVVLLDRWGRRILLLCSVSTMAFAATLLTFTLEHVDADWAPAMCVVSMAIYVTGFGAGLGPVPTLLGAEVYPSQYRSAGAGLTWFVTWLCNFCLSLVFLFQVNFLGANAFLPHLIVLLLGFFLFSCSVPESRGKSLEVIEKEMMSGW